VRIRILRCDDSESMLIITMKDVRLDYRDCIIPNVNA
jgi:hypothetical protein